MASTHVFVLDSSFKRTQIKVTPGKYLREVLEEACKSRKLNPESYMLKTQNNKTVDLSQPFRLSGLSAGAKLQLTQASRSPSVVNVALQLPESDGGGRLSDKFPSTTSLWLVLRKYEDAVAGQPSQKLNLTQRAVPQNVGSGAGRLEYEQPCLHLMGRNLETFTDLQKTLAQLGFNSGSVLIRLTYKNSGQPLEEAMQNIGQYFTSIDPAATGTASNSSDGAHAAPPSQMQSIPDASAENAAAPSDGAAAPEPNEDTPMPDTNETSTQPRPNDDDIIATSTETPPTTINGMTVFRAPTSTTPAAALQADDPTLFEPSIDQAKAHQASLTRSSKPQRLASDAELAAAASAQRAALAAVQTVTVRVRYPDQSMIETTVPASQTSAELYARVTDTLAHAPEPFELRFTGAKGAPQVLPPTGAQRLVRDFGFRGKVLVTLVWGPDVSDSARRAPCLKDEYRVHARDLKVELGGREEDDGRQRVDVVRGSDGDAASGSGSGNGKEKGKGDLEAKMKKFLGFGKK